MSVVLATAGYDHKIRFWEAPSGICSRIIKFSDSQVNRLEITPDKQFIAAAGNPTIRLYEIAAATTATPSTSNKPPSSSANANNNYDTQQPNNSSNATGGGVPPTQQPVLTLEGHTGNVTSLGFQKDGQFLYTGSEDGTVKIWDLRNPNYSRSFHSGSAVNSVTLRRDRDELISGDQNGYVKVWDLGGSGSISTTNKQTSPSSKSGSSSSSSSGCISSIQPAKVASNIFHRKTNSYGGSNGTNGGNPILSDRINTTNNNPASNTNNNNNPNTNFRSNGSRQQQQYYTEGITPIQAVDISEDSRTLVTITNHGTVFVWDPSNSGSVVAAQQLEHLLGAATSASDDKNNNSNTAGTANASKIIGNSGGATMRGMIHPNYLRPVTKFRVANPGTYCLHGKIAPDCRHLVTTSSDGTAKLWDTITWEVTQTLVHRPIQHNNNNNHHHINTTSGGGGESPLPSKRWVWDAAFCADSSYLVTACSDHVARLWNLRTGDVVRQYHGHQSAVTCVALNDRSI